MNDKTKVVFLGSRPLGAFALRLLRAMKDIELVACVAKKPPRNAWWTDDPYFSGCPVLESHEGLSGVDFDLGVSINYWKIMPPEVITPPKLGFINLHHAFNLSLRGRNMAAHAILSCRDSKRWFHGSCLHYTDDGLDTGPIIASRACDITETDTGWSLFNKTEKIGEELLTEWLPRLCLSRVPAAYPEKGHPIHFRSSGGDDYKFIENLSSDPLRAYDIVRAFEFNGYFSPAYTVIDGITRPLTITKELGGETLIELGADRAIYQLSVNQ